MLATAENPQSYHIKQTLSIKSENIFKLISKNI